MNLTKDFTLAEMQCPCGHCNGGTMDQPFMECLQILRDRCRFSFHVNSGYRCHEHNKEVGGQPASLHLSGRATDIRAKNAVELYSLVKYSWECGLFGVGIAQDFVHLDNRTEPTVWVYPITK